MDPQPTNTDHATLKLSHKLWENLYCILVALEQFYWWRSWPFASTVPTQQLLESYCTQNQQLTQDSIQQEITTTRKSTEQLINRLHSIQHHPWWQLGLLIRHTAGALRFKSKDYQLPTDGLPALIKQYEALHTQNPTKTESLPPKTIAPTLLTIMHDGEGGTQHTTRQLIEQCSTIHRCILLKTGLTAWWVYEVQHGITRLIQEFRFKHTWQVNTPLSPEHSVVLTLLCENYTPTIAHIHHFLGHHPQSIEILKAHNVKVVLSLHDYHLVCPGFKLINEADQFCSGKCANTDHDCALPANWYPHPTRPMSAFSPQWRAQLDPLLQRCDHFIAPSRYTLDLITTHYPWLSDASTTIIEHGIERPAHFAPQPHKPKAPIQVLFLGTLSHDKGATLIEGLLHENQQRQCPIHLHILGDAPALTKDHQACTLHGAYHHDQLFDRLAEINPHLILLPSIWPETFCCTLSEAWAAGIPVLGSNLGAIGQRINHHQGGWTLPPENPAHWLDTLLEITNNPDTVATCKQKIQAIQLPTPAEAHKTYTHIYQQLTPPPTHTK